MENELIRRQAAIDAMNRHLDTIPVVNNNTMEMIRRSEVMDCREIINDLPSAQPERMTNRQWIDFLSVQFDISRTSAKEMLHGMMQWKKEDNFKKMFNGGKK